VRAYIESANSDELKVKYRFVESVCNDPNVLEQLSGVADLTAGLDDIDLLDDNDDSADDW